MVGDRTLQHIFGIRPQTVARWGNPIRGFTTLTALLICAGLAGVYANTIRNTIEIRLGQDFGVFYDSALGAHRESDRPNARSQEIKGRVLPSPNLNPPHFNVIVAPFTQRDLPRAFHLWIGTSAIALVASVVVICRSVGVTGWAVLAVCVFLWTAAPMITTLLTGQVGLVLLLPFTLAWAAARRHRDVEAAVWTGVCASIKPFFLLFVPYWLARGRYVPAVIALIPVMVFSTAGMVYYGADAYRTWLDDVLAVTWAEQYLNASVLGFVERTLSASEWGQVPVVDAPQLVVPVSVTLWAGIFTATLWRVRVLPSVDDQVLLVTTAALLLSPLGWVYYVWFLAPPFVAIVSRITKIGTREVALGMSLAGFLIPPFLPLRTLTWSHGLGTVTCGSIYFWSLVVLWGAALQRPRRHEGGAPRVSGSTTEASETLAGRFGGWAAQQRGSG